MRMIRYGIGARMEFLYRFLWEMGHGRMIFIRGWGIPN